MDADIIPYIEDIIRYEYYFRVVKQYFTNERNE